MSLQLLSEASERGDSRGDVGTFWVSKMWQDAYGSYGFLEPFCIFLSSEEITMNAEVSSR